MPYKKDRFQRGTAGSGCYTCISCGKKTRETGEGESSCEMCKQCFWESGQENYHVDNNHEGEAKDCPKCKEEGAIFW